MKNVTFRRFGAYLIDLVIISLVGVGLSYIPFLQESEKEYEVIYQEIVDMYESYTNNEITMNEYQEKYTSMSYDLNRSNYLYTIIQLVIIILYFTFVPFFMHGQTFGKKVMKIQVKSSNDQESVGVISYFLRSIIQNNILITVAQLVILFTFTKDNYYMIYNNVNMVGYVLLYFIVFLVLVRKDSRGLHDLLAGTQVVFVSYGEEQDIRKEDKEESNSLELSEEKEVSDEKKNTKPKKKGNSTKKKEEKEIKKNTKKSTKPQAKS
ncbi:MAG: RDD family protein [Bacilli bacterium]|nr:RDD family protein [Bacilli bacterium]